MKTTTKPRPPLTHSQTCVLEYMAKFLQLNDQLPTMANIASAFGWASPNAADSHAKALEKKGYLVLNEIGGLMFAERQPTACIWEPTEDHFETNNWASSCGELWSFIEGGPEENRVKYCHHCGHPVLIKVPA